MPDIDDRLQHYLSQIEAGVPKDKVISTLSTNEQELVALIKLADAMRTISHPMPAASYSRAAKRKIMAAAPQERVERKRKNSQLGWLLFPSLTGAVALFLVMFITFATLGVWLAGPAAANTATVQNIEGIVELAENRNPDEWFVMTDGEVVHSGQLIRTSPGSTAVLVFSDGSRSRLGPETELFFNEIDGNWSGDIKINIEQILGRTTHQVVQLRSQAAHFDIQTPAGLASVKGTNFTVDVQTNGVARVIVENGEVSVASATDELIIPAGQATVIEPGSSPESPGSFFSIVDVVTAINSDQWEVSSQDFRINNQTSISGAPSIGEILQIEGRILPGGDWIADRIAPVENIIRSSFAGEVEGIADGSWSIGGKQVTINNITVIQDLLDIGDVVEVVYLALSDERWLALDISQLVETIDESEETLASETALNEAATTVPSTPVETAVAACLGEETLASANALAERFQVPVAEIATWVCEGFDLDEVEFVYNLNEMTGQPIFVIFSLNKTMGWSEIHAYLMQFQSANQDGELSCIGNAYHPKAQQLAFKYGVSYAQVINLVCAGNGFNNIDLALSLAADYGTSVDEVLAMKLSGKPWGQIKKELRELYGDKPGNSDKDKKVPPGQEKKDKDKDKKVPPGQEKKE